MYENTITQFPQHSAVAFGIWLMFSLHLSSWFNPLRWLLGNGWHTGVRRSLTWKTLQSIVVSYLLLFSTNFIYSLSLFYYSLHSHSHTLLQRNYFSFSSPLSPLTVSFLANPSHFLALASRLVLTFISSDCFSVSLPPIFFFFHSFFSLSILTSSLLSLMFSYRYHLTT